VTSGFEELPPYGETSIKLMRKYARLHGYTVLLDKLIPVQTTAGAKLYERYMPWQKIASLQRATKAFPQARLYAWLDLDCFLLNMTLSLERLLDKEYVYADNRPHESAECHIASVPDVNLHYAKDWLERAHQTVPLDAMVNAGLVVIRNSPSGLATLERWDVIRTNMPDLYKQYDYGWMNKKDSDPYKGWPGEQGGLWHIFTHDVRPRAGACVPSSAKSWTMIHNQEETVLTRLKIEQYGCSLNWFKLDSARRGVFCRDHYTPLPLVYHGYGLPAAKKNERSALIMDWHKRDAECCNHMEVAGSSWLLKKVSRAFG